MSLRKLANELRQHHPGDAPAHTTLKDWFATRKSLPHKPLFLTLVAVLGLDEHYWGDEWERWHRARQVRPPVPEVVDPTYTAPDDAEPPGAAPVSWRRLVQPSVVVVAVVALTLLVVVVSQARSAPGGRPDVGAPVPADAVGRGLSGGADPSRTPSPARPARLGPSTSSATAANSGAHVDFHRDGDLFRLYDDRSDGRSAILELRIDGAVAGPWYNSRGKTDATHPAKEVQRPPVAPDASVEFRVCVGEYGDPVPERTCGAWISDPG